MLPEELEIVRLTNTEREKAGVPALRANHSLAQAARSHAREMLDLNYFGHVSPTPGQRQPADRVALNGIRNTLVAENIFEAEGYPISEVPRVALTRWMESHAHRVIILNPRYTNMGVGLSLRGDRVTVTEVFSTDP